MTEPFLGRWILDPSTCAYGSRPVPRRGIYDLSAGEHGVLARVWWIDAEGVERSTSFEMVVDGAPRPLPDGSSLVCRVDEGALVSEVVRDAAVVHAARRTLSADGRSMLVTQTFGPSETIEATYFRGLPHTKQVLLYRRDLNMRKGKIAAQVAHASLKVFLDRDRGSWDRLVVPLDEAMSSWTHAGFAKIVLSVESEDDLVRAWQAAKDRGLPTALVTDAGHTEFHGVPTRTVVAIGPARADDIDAITGPGGSVPTKLA